MRGLDPVGRKIFDVLATSAHPDTWLFEPVFDPAARQWVESFFVATADNRAHSPLKFLPEQNGVIVASVAAAHRELKIVESPGVDVHAGERGQNDGERR